MRAIFCSTLMTFRFGSYGMRKRSQVLGLPGPAWRCTRTSKVEGFAKSWFGAIMSGVRAR